jgi:hypothetical protein
MKPFLPYLLVPALGLTGWMLSSWVSGSAALSMPPVMSLDAPPALGVTPVTSAGEGPVSVSLDAFLPMTRQDVVAVARHERPPQVKAILLLGAQRLAQIGEVPMVEGDLVGNFRITGIESERVLFEHLATGESLWVSLTEP